VYNNGKENEHEMALPNCVAREIFVGGMEKGLWALRELMAMKARVVWAYVLKEDEHELEKFSPQIIALCKKYKIPFTLTRSIKKEYE
jgi:hypothetical protein